MFSFFVPFGGKTNTPPTPPPTASPEQKAVKESSPERDKLKVPAKQNDTPSQSSVSDLSSISVIPGRNDNDSNGSDEPEDRATRRARGKSVYLTCFAGIDCVSIMKTKFKNTKLNLLIFFQNKSTNIFKIHRSILLSGL